MEATAGQSARMCGAEQSDPEAESRMAPMITTSATNDVADAIADIEKRRLTTETEVGMAMAFSTALHRLYDLLHHETEGLRLRGPASAHLPNVEAVSIEIGRVKKLAVVKPEGKTCKSVGHADDR